MTQKSAIKGNVFLKRAIAFLCALVTISSLFLYLNINPLNTEAKDSIVYTFSVDGKTADGKTVVYYKSDKKIASYEKTNSYVNVSYCGYNSYSISVSSNVNCKANNYQSVRKGWVTFKDSSGNVIDKCRIEQDNPYIKLARQKYHQYLTGEKGAFEEFTITYNCPFRITTDYTYQYEIKNRSGGKVYEGGSYSKPNGSKTAVLWVISKRDNTSTCGADFKVIASKKGSTSVISSLNYSQLKYKIATATYTATKNKLTYTLKGDKIQEGDVILQISGDRNFPLYSSAKVCMYYKFKFTKKNGKLYSERISSTFDKELIDDGYNCFDLGYAEASLDGQNLYLYLYSEGDTNKSNVQKYVFTKN